MRINRSAKMHIKIRNNEEFTCVKCGHSANADVNAAVNILQRFISGPYVHNFMEKYSAGCKLSKKEL
jgi:transposase